MTIENSAKTPLESRVESPILGRLLARCAGRRATVLVAALVLGACRSEGAVAAALSVEPDVRVLAGADITLAPGESVVAIPGALTLTFVRVTGEARCPVNATIQCLWGGTAAIALLATSLDGKRTLTLETRPGADTVAIDRFQVQLVRLDPVPVTLDPIPLASYRATVRLRAR